MEPFLAIPGRTHMILLSTTQVLLCSSIGISAAQMDSYSDGFITVSKSFLGMFISDRISMSVFLRAKCFSLASSSCGLSLSGVQLSMYVSMYVSAPIWIQICDTNLVTGQDPGCCNDWEKTWSFCQPETPLHLVG